LTTSAPRDAITMRRVSQILRAQWLVCLVVALVVLLVGSAVVLTRPKSYQSTSSVALLPAASNQAVLPNYPNLITSLIPTYVQLVSSPVLLNQVADKLPFRTSGAQLSNDVHAESLTNAAIITIVANSPNAVQAREIAAAATSVFLAQLRGNGVVVAKVYGQPSAPDKAARGTALKLLVVLVLAVLLGLAAGLIWDRMAGGGVSVGQRTGRGPPVPDHSPDGRMGERVPAVGRQEASKPTAAERAGKSDHPSKRSE
jgi:capsular polysaccharide biosynthesis protein